MGIFDALRSAITNIEDVVNRVEINIKPEPAVSSSSVPPVTKTGLSLVKGQRITLEKNGQNLTNVCVGVNWGMINGRESVDLDVSCITYSGKNKDQVVYYGNLRGQGVVHSGDDLRGDATKDLLDNEIITLDLQNIKTDVDKIFIVLNSYSGHQFDRIPYATIRVYEGTNKRVDNVIATYNVANDNTFKGKVTMLLGNLYRHGNGWKFNAIGEPTSDRTLSQTTETISQQFI